MAIRILSLILFLLPTNAAMAQDISNYEVLPGSTDNQLTIRITNPNKEAVIKHVAMGAVSKPDWVNSLEFSSDDTGELRPGETRNYIASFSISGNAPSGNTGRLSIDIDAEGGVYPTMKQVVVELTVRGGKQREETSIAGTCGGTGNRVLHLVDVQWLPPTGSDKNKAIRHKEGQPGFSYHPKRWGNRTIMESVGFTNYPESITLGSPFEVTAEMHVSLEATTPTTCTAGFFLRRPSALFGLGAYSTHPGTTNLEGKFEGE